MSAEVMLETPMSTPANTPTALPANRGLMLAENLLLEQSVAGRHGIDLPKSGQIHGSRNGSCSHRVCYPF